jgi:hypothetical protein
MPTPNELRVLRTAMELGAVTKRKISSEMGINTEYAGYLLESLSKKGFLLPASPGKFGISFKGSDALLFQLRHIKAILEAKAYGTVRLIETTNNKIGYYDNQLIKQTISKYASQ